MTRQEHADRLRDPDRLLALQRTGLLDTPAEPGLDRLTKLAARILGVPVVLATLIDEDRQFFASQVGAPADVAAARQTPLSHSLCQYVVADAAELIVTDTREQERLRHNGAVVDLDVIAYAGVPMHGPSGDVLGSFCAIAHEPRTWSDEQLATLRDIAAAAAREIELHALLGERVEEVDRLALLAQIGSLTATIDDPELLAAAVVDVLVPDLCDWAVIEIEPDEEGGEKSVHFGALDDELLGRAVELRTVARATAGWRSPTIAATTHGLPVHIPRVELAMFAPDGDVANVSDHLAGLVEAAGLRSVSAVPMTARNHVIGAISFIRSDLGRPFKAGDLHLHEEIGLRVALAVEAGRLRVQLARRARATHALEAIADGVALVDSDGVVLLWNPAAERLTDIAADTALGARLSDVLPALDGAIGSTAPEHTDNMRVVRIDTAAGAERWLAVSSVRAEGVSALAMRDVTDERELERTREELVATVSHQLRTPVAGILAAAVTLQRDDIVLDPAVEQQVLDTIVAQAERLAQLCNDVLLAHRLSDGAHTLLVDRVALGPVLRELVAAARVRSPDLHDVRAIIPDVLPDVAGDEHALLQLLGNLVDNSIKYSPDGGPIEIGAAVVGDGVNVWVQDAGIGIPSDQFTRVFERFHRLDPQMARHAGGAGLGLYVVRELATLMGATVEASGNPDGPGTRMLVHLPLA